MTSIKVEQNHTGEFLVSEGQGGISREQITLAAGPALATGQVLAKDDDGHYVPFDKAKAEDAPAAAVLYGALCESDSTRQATAIVRLAEVAVARLVGFDETARAGLAANNLIDRE